MTAAPTVADPSAEWSTARRNWFLAVLCLIGLISFVDRQIITILLEPIKEEFNASDTAMGALTGIIFSGSTSESLNGVPWCSAGRKPARVADPPSPPPPPFASSATKDGRLSFSLPNP